MQENKLFCPLIYFLKCFSLQSIYEEICVTLLLGTTALITMGHWCNGPFVRWERWLHLPYSLQQHIPPVTFDRGLFGSLEEAFCWDNSIQSDCGTSGCCFGFFPFFFFLFVEARKKWNVKTNTDKYLFPSCILKNP